jgi:putative mRNA 3-end processing factor
VHVAAPVPGVPVSSPSALAGSRPYYASRETTALLGTLGFAHGPLTAIEWGETIERQIRPEFGGGIAKIRVAPAGHVLGAAQLIVDHPHGTLVYTGDWSPYADATHPAGEVITCDELVVTCTFALPVFRFEPPQRVTHALVDWCAEQLTGKTTPVVLAPSPGPAQSLVRALGARGLPVMGTADVRAVCEAYARLGAALGPLGDPEAAEAGRSHPSAVLVASPAARASELRVRGARSVAYASGWALLNSAVEQKRADAAFALADHADFDALTTLVVATGARVVHAVHGDGPTFAHLLRKRGIDADAFDLAAIDSRSVA